MCTAWLCHAVTIMHIRQLQGIVKWRPDDRECRFAVTWLRLLIHIQMGACGSYSFFLFFSLINIIYGSAYLCISRTHPSQNHGYGHSRSFTRVTSHLPRDHDAPQPWLGNRPVDPEAQPLTLFSTLRIWSLFVVFMPVHSKRVTNQSTTSSTNLSAKRSTTSRSNR